MNEKFSKKLLAIPIAISFLIIALFCFFVIGLSRVDAETLSWGETTFTFEWDSTIDYVPTPSYGIASNTPKRETLYIYNWEGYTRPYTYIIMEFCSNNPTMIEKMYISNTNYNDNYINDGSGATYITNQTCKMGQYDGYIIKKQFEVGKYGALDNTGYELVSAGYLNYTNTYPYSALIMLQNISLSSDDVLSNLSQSQSNLKEELDAINNQTEDIIEHQEAVKDAIINNNNSNTDKITQNQDKNQQQTNERLEDIEDAITDDTAPNLDAFDNMSGWLPPGPLDSVLNIPLNILNGLVGAFNNNSCSAISIPIPFIGGNLSLPCLYNLYSAISGLSIALTTFFTAIAGYLMFKYLSNLYVWIDKTLKMEENSYMQDWGGV